MKKNPGRKERRKAEKIAHTKGYGNQDKYFSKKVSARKAKKKRDNSK
ncbi:unnamed protein product [marine sediment metagenome]|uniref:Uncharacterized protein n=1 Tax=marine sediment metagenome TaxID=412755 RepID=X0VLH2_9ZZZZ